MKKRDLKVAILGATGPVGDELVNILHRDGQFLYSQVILSNSSGGYNGRFKTIGETLNKQPDFVFSALPANIAKEVIPAFIQRGAVVIDKSSAFRKDINVPLIIPEVNGYILTGEEKLIASPNCTTTQLVVALAPLHQKYGLKRVIVSTYQSASGAGRAGINQLQKEERRETVPVSEMVFHPRLFGNVLPECGTFTRNGFTTEEEKLKYESQRILNLPDLKVHATCVRVPVKRAHSMSVHAEFNHPLDLVNVQLLLMQEVSGIELADNWGANEYPTPLEVSGQRKVYVGRIRIDKDEPNRVDLWVVADNLRKGAALNAWQIMEHILKLKGWSE